MYRNEKKRFSEAPNIKEGSKTLIRCALIIGYDYTLLLIAALLQKI